MKEGSCLATKHNCHLSKPEELELNMSVERGKDKGEYSAIANSLLLKNNLFKLSFKTTGEGGGHVNCKHLHPTKWHCADMVHAQSSFIISEVALLQLSHPHCTWIVIFGN